MFILFSRFRPFNANLCTPSCLPQVRLNGYALKPPELRRLSGYVLQDDILPAMLTVNTHNKKP
jgi:ABC-type multidrug transport system ATPase subunit